MVLATTENTERLGKKACLSLPKGRSKGRKIQQVNPTTKISSHFCPPFVPLRLEVANHRDAISDSHASALKSIIE